MVESVFESVDQSGEIAVQLGRPLQRGDKVAIVNRASVGLSRLMAMHVPVTSWLSSSLIGVSPAALLNTCQVASSTWTRAMWSRRSGLAWGATGWSALTGDRPLFRRRRDIDLDVRATTGGEPLGRES